MNTSSPARQHVSHLAEIFADRLVMRVATDRGQMPGDLLQAIGWITADAHYLTAAVITHAKDSGMTWDDIAQVLGTEGAPGERGRLARQRWGGWVREVRRDLIRRSR